MDHQNRVRFSYLLIAFFLFSLFNLSVCWSDDYPHDENVLLEIKEQFGNHSSGWLEAWDPNTDFCNDWSYIYSPYVNISCDRFGHVLGLSIQLADDITSDFPPAIGDLISLRSLELTGLPHLNGPIPLSICKLSNLVSLSITYNNLSGPIPDCIGQLKSLTSVDLSGNGLSGQIPPSLVQLPKLNVLYLMLNNLSGPIPEFPKNAIFQIKLDNNKLSGPIPKSLGLLSSLAVLGLSNNQLNGTILPSLGNMSSLRVLDLSYNRFRGRIPESFGSLTPSIYLYLQGNQLSGPLPQSLGQLNAITLDLSYNRLAGDASFLFARDKSWTEKILLNNNRFSFNFSNVEIPEPMTMLYSILNISHNRIYGSLPNNLASVRLVDVSYNRLCGAIPSGCEKFGVNSFKHNRCLCGPPLAACK